MTENTVSEPGNLAEHESQKTGLTDSPLVGSGDLGPQQVAFAGLAMCNSDLDIHCGLSVVPAGRAPETIAATDDVPVRVDWLQHELHQGPSMGADSGEMLVVKDLAADERWPDFGKMCVAVMNVRSMTSIQIPVPPPDRARLNFYSSDPRAFDHLDLNAASGLARLAAPIVRVVIREFGERLLRAAPSDCSRVAIAVGTVIARYRVNSADAFALLREASHDLRRALLGVAMDVVAEGRLPEAAIIEARRRRNAGGRLSQARAPAAATLPSVRTQSPGPHERPGRPAAQRMMAYGGPAIGGPEMWHDPSAPDR